eukprot:403336432
MTCESINAQTIKVVLRSTLNGPFQLNIINAIVNPTSSSPTSSLGFYTYEHTSGALQDFQNTSITVMAASSQFYNISYQSLVTQQAGEIDQIKITFKARNSVKMSQGSIQIIFPYLFNISSDNLQYSMIETANLTCYFYDTISPFIHVTDCSFDSSKQTLTFTSIFSNMSLAKNQTLSIGINGLKNPISTLLKSQLTVMTTDKNFGEIDKGTITISATKPSDIMNATLTAQNPKVQEVTNYTLQFRVKVPMYAGCQITISLPWPDYDLNVDSIQGIQGFGLFGAIRSLNYQINSKLNTITLIDACKTYALPNFPASIYILGIKNPQTDKTTGTFIVNIVDSNNGQVASLDATQNLKFQSMSGGFSQVSLTTDSSTVNQTTNLTLYFTPNHTTNQKVNITLYLNDTEFRFSSDTAIIDTNISDISNSQIKLLSNQTLAIYGFKPNLQSGQTYYVTLSNFQLASTMRNLTNLQLNISQLDTQTQTTYYLIDSQYYNTTPFLTTLSGEFYKAYATPKSYVTSNVTIYEFLFQTQNDIPLGGYLEIKLPNEIQVELQNSGSSIGLRRQLDTTSSQFYCQVMDVNSSCSYSLANNTIKIYGYFVDHYYPRQSDLNVRVFGIKNPRSTKPSSQFYYRSIASNFGIIDTFTSTSSVVTMSDPANFITSKVSSISSLRVADKNTSITLTISLSNILVTSDQIYLILPSQISVNQSLLNCQSSFSKISSSHNLDCVQTNYNTIKITLSLTNDKLDSNTQLDLKISGITNPSNGRPTDNFEMYIIDDNNYQIARLQDSKLSIQMTLPQLLTSGFSITTTSKSPGLQTTIDIYFNPLQDIPSGSQIILTYPSQVGFEQNSLIISSSKSIGKISYIVDKTTRQITAKEFFTLDVQGGTEVRLTISGFTNSNFSTPTDSFKIDVYTNESYPITSIQSGLNITAKCNWPCKDCNIVNGGPSTCTACNTKDIASNAFILQESKCVAVCYSGYFFQGTANVTGQCLKCDTNCLTCNSTAKDCSTCDTKSKFPYLIGAQCVTTCPNYYISDKTQGKCLECKSPCRNCTNNPTTCTSCINNTFLLSSQCLQTCPSNGLYINQPANWTCQGCSSNCSTCTGNITTCTTCKSGFKLNTIDNKCISKCPVDITVDLNNKCQVCSANCKTCFGSTSNCTTCPASQVLYNGKCYGSCPIGSTQTLGTSLCVNCSSECSECVNGNPNQCTGCKPGFNSFEFTKCLKDCPLPYQAKNGYCIDPSLRCDYGYEINRNGTFCVLSAYTCEPGYKLNNFLKKCVPLPGFYIPFPFLFLLLLITTIILLVLKVKNKLHETNLIQTTICIWAAFEPFLYLIQFVLACAYEHLAVLLITLFAILFYYPLNFYIVKIVIKRRFAKDSVINHWISEYPNPHKYIMNLSLYHNQKLLRLLTCSFYGMPQYQATFDDISMNYLKPQLRATIINALSSYLLILVADITCFVTVEWGYQLLIVCIESLVFILIMLTLQIIDYFQMKNLYLRNKQYYKVNAKSLDMGSVRGAFQDNDDSNNQNLINNPLRKKSLDRRQVLEKLTQDLYKKENQVKNQEQLDYYLLLKAKNEAFDEFGITPLDDLETERNLLGSKGYASRNHQNANLIPNQSTNNHNAENRVNMLDNYDNEGDDDELWNKCISERDQSQYGDIDALDQARLLFAEINREIVQQKLERQKVLDIMEYNAKMSMLDGTDHKLHLTRPQFTLQDVMGHFQRDQDGNYIIIKNHEGQLIDLYGRSVNQRGYLIDSNSNIVTKDGEFVVQKDLLNKNEDIPIKLFKRLFMPRGFGELEEASRSNKQLSAAFSRSQKTIRSMGTGKLSRSLNDAEINAVRSSLGLKSLKSIGIDPKSSHTTIINEPLDEKIQSEEEPYQIDIQFDMPFAAKQKPQPQKSVKKKRVKTAKIETKTIQQRNQSTTKHLTTKGSNIDVKSQRSTSTVTVTRSFGGDKAIRIQSSSMARKSSGRSYQTSSNNNLNESVRRSLPINPKKIQKNMLRDSGSVTLKRPSIQSNNNHRSKKRRFSAGSNNQDIEEEIGNHSQSRKRPAKSQETISETQSHMSRIIKPRIPKYKPFKNIKETSQNRASSQKTVKKSQRYVLSQPSQDHDMFSINITIPGHEQQNNSRERKNNSKSRKNKFQIINQQDQNDNKQKQDGPFNLIDFMDTKNRFKNAIPYHSIFDPLQNQLKKIKQEENQQLEDLKRDLLGQNYVRQQEETVRKFQNIPNQFVQQQQYQDQQQFVQPQSLETIQQQQYPIQDLQAMIQQRPQSQKYNFNQINDNQTTLKKQTSQIETMSSVYGGIQNNNPLLGSQLNQRSAFKNSGKLIMNNTITATGQPVEPKSLMQKHQVKNNQINSNMTINQFNHDKKLQNNNFMANNQSLQNFGYITTDQVKTLNQLEPQQINQNFLNDTEDMKLLRDMKAQFHPSIKLNQQLVSPAASIAFSAQSIYEMTKNKIVNSKFDGKLQKGKSKLKQEKPYSTVMQNDDNFTTIKKQQVSDKPPLMMQNNKKKQGLAIKNTSMLSNKLKNMQDIYSQNVRQTSNNSGVGVQQKPQLRGLSSYDSYVDNLALNAPINFYNNGDANNGGGNTISDDAYKTLNKIFSSK